ncbi:fimbrial protein [Edwardsiella tarda]|uniref:fimbrial protein n=1 Tax=Edwardsiella tarda TaxID=636 RepID=UPI003D2EE3B6
MKNLLVISSLALAVISGSALADSGEVQFLGVVANTTCKVTPEVNGSVSNLVQLGTAQTNGVGPVVSFALKGDPTQSGCDTAALTGKTASIGWSGSFDSNGLKAQSGSATDAWTAIKTVNASGTPVQSINSTHLSSDFSATDVVSTTGAQYTAQLNGGTIAGDYQSAAAYVVAYN